MLREIHVFLVDDDEDDQQFFELSIKGQYPKIVCRFANDGVDAIEQLNTNPEYFPDYIFIDINMPRMNGIECLNELRKLKRFDNVPIYMYTTTSEPRIVESCVRLGAKGVVHEVTHREVLKNMLSDIFYGERSMPPASKLNMNK